ncbi:MAG: HypC/HybG/HupF family hydrogenase formation chaperone [Candidatus Sedimenticola sp. (ex Thyasira tokunagai)]
MCIGAPVQVVESNDFTARCRDRNGQEMSVNMMLVGPQPVGTWVVSFLGSARDVLAPEDAESINAAMSELELLGRVAAR